MENFFKNIFIPQSPSLSPQESIILFVIFIWSIVWKGVALWHAAQNREKIWFVVVLVANTAGILEILYLFVLSKKKLEVKNVKDKLKELLRGNFQ